MSQDSYKNHLYGLLLAGGGGTRLWPKSVEETPKQFLKLFGKKTLTEITAERLTSFLPWEKIFVVTTTQAYGKEIKKLLPKIPAKNLIVEPMRRDSAPAHAIGAMAILKKDPNAIIINAASDHFVNPLNRYKRTMFAASRAANEKDCLVAVGIPPLYPHTGMGHIKRGEKVATIEGKSVYNLDKFVEKPPIALAKRYTNSGHYFWNANHYVWRADTFLKALAEHAPDISKGIAEIEKNWGKASQESTMKKEYEKMPKISVDYAVSEKAKNSLMLVADYNWTDIGDWNEVWKHLSKDASGNAIIDGDSAGGEVMTLNTTDTLIHSDGRMIAVVDVDNIVIVDTHEALLICSKSHSQNVKKIVEELKSKNRKDLL